MRCSLLTLGLLGLALTLSGCESFGRGVARALIDEARSSTAQTPVCDITGPAYGGLAGAMQDATPDRPRTTRLLVIHGIGPQEPGYSEFLVRRLADGLALPFIDPDVKTFTLASARFPNNGLGTLRLSRYFDGAGRALMVFEVTWSRVTEDERALVAFDDFAAASTERADINKSIKSFVNRRLIDPLAYLGPSGERILESVAQSMCWMTQGPWDSYPDAGADICRWENADAAAALDAYAMAGHSLGSRIALDTLTTLGQTGAESDNDVLRRAFRDKTVPLFMLSNQLPLLQSGRVPPAVTNAEARYCAPGAPGAEGRWLGRLDIVAFSDPNDLLTYPIPTEFADRYIDSRLCSRITNVTIKVAPEISLAGLTTFASPEDAHVNYERDDRVLALMVNGLGPGAAPPQSCRWLQVAPSRPAPSARPQS